jgi:hypothetical protein
MKNAKKLLPFLAANALLNNGITRFHEPDFHLPYIPDDERIRVHTPKVKKHHETAGK